MPTNSPAVDRPALLAKLIAIRDSAYAEYQTNKARSTESANYTRIYIIRHTAALSLYTTVAGAIDALSIGPKPKE
jgi:hypothetical protein